MSTAPHWLIDKPLFLTIQEWPDGKCTLDEEPSKECAIESALDMVAYPETPPTYRGTIVLHPNGTWTETQFARTSHWMGEKEAAE